MAKLWKQSGRSATAVVLAGIVGLLVLSGGLGTETRALVCGQCMLKRERMRVLVMGLPVFSWTGEEARGHSTGVYDRLVAVPHDHRWLDRGY
jgi:hypothetical protein